MTNPKAKYEVTGRFSFENEARGISQHQYPVYDRGPNVVDYLAETASLIAKTSRWDASLNLNKDKELHLCLGIVVGCFWVDGRSMGFQRLLQLRRKMSAREFDAMVGSFSAKLVSSDLLLGSRGANPNQSLIISHAALASAWSYHCEVSSSPVWLAGSALYALLAHEDEFAFGYLVSELKQKMQNEEDALRGQATLASAVSGGKTRSRQNASMVEERLNEMRRLIGLGHSLARAAQLANQNGFGVTAGANRKLWARHKK